MGTDDRNRGAGMRLAMRAMAVGWKLAVLAAIAVFVLYRVRYAPVSVDSQVAAVGPIASEVMGTGTLEARVSATISPKISGLITQVLADQGDRVKKGQVLATLYDGDLRQQVEMAKADLATAQAGVDRAAADIASAEATAVQASASYARNAQLFSQKLVSDDDFGKATQERDVAQAQLRRAQLAKVELERQVLKGDQTQRYYQELLGYTSISSPFDGLVIRRSTEPGDVIVPGSEILQIISTDEMWVSAWVDETAMVSLAVNQPARVVFRSEPDNAYDGSVARLAPSTDRETREFLVDVTVKELPKVWAVGQRAEVYIQTAKKDDALLVPQQAVAWRKGQPGLFVSNSGHAKWHTITLGLRGAESVEVTDGLTAGDLVVWPLDPKNGSLTEGRAVAPVSAK